MNLGGQRIGRFVVERELGQSASGAVWLARDPQSLRQVAIKLLHYQPAPGSPEAHQFQREIHALQALRHPAMVPLLEVGAHGNRPFLVLGYFAGGDLAQRLRARGPLGARQAARLVLRLAEGLELAHQSGILHRTLSPQSVLLSAADEPALTGFGLARFGHQQRFPNQPGASDTGGSSDELRDFLAPEVVHGQREAQGVGADIYGLGGILYACLTGRSPAAGTPPGKLVRRLPPELERICMRCLAPQPGGRFPTARAVAAGLQGFLAAPSQRSELQRAGSTPWLTLALCLPGIALGGAAIVYVLSTRGADPAVSSVPALPPPTSVEPTETEPTETEPTEPEPPVGDLEIRPLVADPPAADEDPAAAQEALDQALTALKAQRFDEVVVKVNKALSLWPSSPDSLRWRGLRGHAHFEGKRFAQADADFTAFLSRSDQAYPRMQRGICRFLLGHHQAALEDFERAIELDPSQHAAYFWRGAVTHSKGGDLKLAIDDVEHFLRRQRPPHPDIKTARELLARMKSERK